MPSSAHLTVALSLDELTAFAWTMVALAILATIGRYCVRYAQKKSLYWDDLTHGLALLTMIAMVSCFQRLFADSFFLTQIERGEVKPPSQQEAIAIFIRDRKLQYALTALYFTSTWLVKASFMIFYRTLFNVKTVFMKAWWATAVILVFGFVACFVGVITECGHPRDLTSYQICTEPGNLEYTVTVTKYSGGISAATDFIIMCLPFSMLRTLKVRIAQKIALGLVFSIGILVFVFEIVRTVKSVQATDFSEVAAYDIAVVTIAIVVSCLPSFRSLITERKRQRATEYYNLRYRSKTKPSTAATEDTYPLSTRNQTSTGHGAEDALETYDMEMLGKAPEVSLNPVPQ